MGVSKSYQHDEVTGFKFGYSPFGKPSLYVHFFYVDGLLIDTGQRRAGAQILKATKDLPIQQIFITHHHEDHSGNIPSLLQQHKCPVYAPGLCCEMMKAPPSMSFPRRLLWGVREPYHQLEAVGSQLKTPNHCFEIIPVPGHAPDMAVLYEPDKKWLFSADLYVNHYIGYMLDTESIKDQITSTRKILELDFDVMFCAHNPQLSNAKPKLAKKLAFLESFYEDVASLYKAGNGAKAIFRQLKLKEDWLVRTLSGGQLSKLNMVKSVIRDIDEEETP